MSEAINDLVGSVGSLTQVVAQLVVCAKADLPGELLTADQLAARLKIPARTLKDQASAGLLPHHRFGKHYRFDTDDIAEILRLTKRQPTRRRSSLQAA